MKKLTLIRYMGGKFFMLSHIYKYLDTTKLCFIDLFGGSGKVILNLNHNYKVKIYNDIDDNVFNLFMQIKNNFQAFAEAIELPYSETLFKQFYKKYKNNDFKDDLEKAVIFYYLKNTTFNGKCDGFGYGFAENQAQKYYNKYREIESIYDNIKDLTILNRDYKDILESIDGKKDIMLYADPPYFGKEHYYEENFNYDEHIKLAEYLNRLQCSVMLSYYSFDKIEELYPKSKWQYIEMSQTKSSYGVTKNSRSKKRATSTELLIMNYSSQQTNFLNKI